VWGTCHALVRSLQVLSYDATKEELRAEMGETLCSSPKKGYRTCWQHWPRKKGDGMVVFVANCHKVDRRVAKMMCIQCVTCLITEMAQVRTVDVECSATLEVPHSVFCSVSVTSQAVCVN
jgi:hypothetical protein